MCEIPRFCRHSVCLRACLCILDNMCEFILYVLGCELFVLRSCFVCLQFRHVLWRRFRRNDSVNIGRIVDEKKK